MQSIKDGIFYAKSSGCDLWIAAGTYYVYKTLPTDTIALPANFRMFGGFSGIETTLEERDLGVNKTILDGADAEGQGNYVYHVVTGADNAVLDGFTVQRGKAMDVDSVDSSFGQGGGLYLYNAKMTVRNCVFDNNTAELAGGGIYAEESVLTLESSVISFNSTGEELGCQGGGVHIRESSAVIDNTMFRLNHSVNGGGLYVAAYQDAPPVIVTNSVFDSNDASNFFGQGAGAMVESTDGVSFNNCIFKENTALEGADGGGLSVLYASAAITDCIFWNNTTGGNGGGLYLSYENNTTVERCVFADNSADSMGDGLFIGYEQTEPKLSDCIFSNHKGEAVLVGYEGGVIIERTVFAGNPGGAIDTYSEAVVAVENSLFVGNVNGYAGAFENNGESSATLRNNTFYMNSLDSGSTISSFNTASTRLVNNIIEGGALLEILKEGERDLFIEYNLIDNWESVGTGNINGTASFVESPSVGDGWDSVVFDEETYRTTLSDSSLNLTLHGIVGTFVLPSPNNNQWYYIVENTETSVTIWGDISEFVAEGDLYVFKDLHLAKDSLGIDAGLRLNAPDKDFDGNFRRDDPSVKDTGLDESGNETYFDIGAFEYLP